MIGKFVAGEGPRPCKYFIVGEGPGRMEASIGRPFVGPAGKELNRYLLMQAGLRRDQCYITNLVKYQTNESNDDPTIEDIAKDEHFLLEELAAVSPELIITVGKVATQYFLGDVEMEFVYGIPQKSEKWPNIIVFPCIHPAAGLHQADRFSQLVFASFLQLGKYLRGELDYILEDYPNPIYTEVKSANSFVGFNVSVDTEGMPWNPWGLSYSTDIFSGQVTRAKYAYNIPLHTADRVIFHHALWDIPVLRAMGIDVESIFEKFEDTMIMAHLLCLEPKRLKALAYRHGHVKMDEYEDITKDDEQRISRDYLRKVLSYPCLSCNGLGEISQPYKRPPKCGVCIGTGRTPTVCSTCDGYGKIQLGPDELDAAWTILESIAKCEPTPIKEKKCKTCKGKGKVIDEGSSICETCTGTGYLAKYKLEKCGVCSGDGTSWPLPAYQLTYNDDFSPRIYQPQSIGRSLRRLCNSESGYRKGWSELRSRISGVTDSIEHVLGPMPQVTLDDIDPKKAIHYSGEDARGTLIVYNKLRPQITKMGLEQAYAIDKGIIPIIDRMHTNGILINKDYFSDLGKKFTEEQLGVQQELYNLVGDYFNPSSPDQVAKQLEKRGIFGLDSTDERTLQMLSMSCKDEGTKKFIDLTLDYRELGKMNSTYVYPLIEQADKNSRVHTTFITTGPATGRLASKNPNLQNIPARTERGVLIRQGFIAREGCVLLSSDLDQIELRVAAHLSQDPAMIDNFLRGLDPHTATASRLFKVPYDEVHPLKQRYPSKTINFLILFGGSEYKLQSELSMAGLDISLEEAKALITDWFAAYPQFKSYMARVHADVRMTGYVRSLFGHIRYLPNVHCKDNKIREDALRQAVNAPIQGTAGELLKIAKINIWNKVMPVLKPMGYFEPLLTIHDEIVSEVEERLAEMAGAMVSYEMAHAAELSVPLAAKAKYAKNWALLK